MYLQELLTLTYTLWSLLPLSDSTNEVTAHIRTVNKQKTFKKYDDSRSVTQRRQRSCLYF